MNTLFEFILYKPLFNLLVFFAWLVPSHSIGWAIILLTILVKLLLWRLQAKALIGPLQMRGYQDELKALQERYKDDRAAQGQAMLAFYKEKGISPFSGCLPALIQLPIIFVLYKVFMIGLGTTPRPDLLYSVTPKLETLNLTFFGLDLSKPEAWVLPTVAALAQFIQSKHYASMIQAPSTSTASNDPTAMLNKQMIYLFPLMTFFFARSFPAGLAVYWITSTLFQIFQQYHIFKTYKPPKPKATVTVRSKGKKK